MSKEGKLARIEEALHQTTIAISYLREGRKHVKSKRYQDTTMILIVGEAQTRLKAALAEVKRIGKA